MISHVTGHPSVVRANYICFNLRKEMHVSWIGIKCSLGLKINGMLACHLLNTTMTGSDVKNSTQANDLNQSKLFHFSDIVRF